MSCRLAIALVVMIALVEVCAALTWTLSTTGRAKDAAPAAERHVGHHRVAEWRDMDGGGAFQESPALRARVAAGALPPVDQRLPDNPLVIVPPEQMGPYGGTWSRLATSANDIATVFTGRLSGDGLLRLGPMGEQVLPNLASRWSVEDGGRTFTLHLRQGVRWSDGEPFSADDVLFWYEHVIREPELRPAVDTVYNHGGEPMRLEKLDDHTIRLTFAEPLATTAFKIASHAAFDDALEFPAHYLKQFHKDFADLDKLRALAQRAGYEHWHQYFNERANRLNPEKPTLAAWRLTRPPPAQTVEYQRNPFYWKVDAEGRQLPYIDRITFQIYGAETINLKALTGEAGMQSRHLQFQNLPVFTTNQSREDYKIRFWPQGTGMSNVVFLNYNHRDPVQRALYEDRRFREALSLAIDRTELNEAFYFGMGEPRQVCPTKESPFYDPAFSRKAIEHAPERADELLDAIGLTVRDDEGYRLRSDGRTLSITIETVTSMSNHELVSLIAEAWRAIGIKADVKVHSRTLWWMRRRATLQDAVVWWGGREQWPHDASHHAYFPSSATAHHAPEYGVWFAGRGERGSAPPKPMRRAMELFRQAQQTTESHARHELLQQMITINREQLYLIGTVGKIPSLVLVPDSFRNVPTRAMYSWTTRSPSNTAPECYAIDPAPRRGADGG